MKANLIVNLWDGLKPNSKHSLKPDLQSAALNRLRPFHQLDYNVIRLDLLAVKNLIKNY